MSRKKTNGVHLMSMAWEKALFENAQLNFDDIFQDHELKQAFRKFCELYHKKMIEKWFPAETRKR